MRNITTDVLRYLNSGEIPDQWVVNDLGTKQKIVNEDFLDEVELQLQIEETELNMPL